MKKHVILMTIMLLIIPLIGCVEYDNTKTIEVQEVSYMTKFKSVITVIESDNNTYFFDELIPVQEGQTLTISYDSTYYGDGRLYVCEYTIED